MAATLFHDKLYDDHWRDVQLGWRHGFWLASVLMAGATALDTAEPAGKMAKDADDDGMSKANEALRLCDLGLLLGAPVDGADLSGIAAALQSNLSDQRKLNQQTQHAVTAAAAAAASPLMAQESKKGKWAAAAPPVNSLEARRPAPAARSVYARRRSI